MHVCSRKTAIADGDRARSRRSRPPAAAAAAAARRPPTSTPRRRGGRERRRTPARRSTSPVTARSRGTPDVMTVTMGVQTTRPVGAGRARSATTSAPTALIATLKRQGVAAKDIQTVDLNVSPNFDKNFHVTGYSASNTVTAKLRDLSKAGDGDRRGRADRGREDVRLQGVSFSIDNTSALVAKARADAIKDALAQGKQLAGAAGVTLGAIRTIDDTGTLLPQPQFLTGGDRPNQAGRRRRRGRARLPAAECRRDGRVRHRAGRIPYAPGRRRRSANTVAVSERRLGGRANGGSGALRSPHERRGRAHVEHREGPRPALDDPRGRALRLRPRLGAAAAPHRPHDLLHPALAPARRVGAVPDRAAALDGRTTLRSRLPPPAHCASPAPARRARSSTRCSRSRPPASTAPVRCGSSRCSRGSTVPTASAPRSR